MDNVMRRQAINFRFVCMCLILATAGLISTNGQAYDREKSINFRVQQAPFLFFPMLAEVPMAQLEFMFRPNKHLNLGLVGNSFSELSETENSTYDLNINSVGFRVDFVLNSDAFSDGFYISNFLMMGMWSSQEESEATCGTVFKSSGQSSITGGSFGYQWFWENGYNVNIGIGAVEISALSNDSDGINGCALSTVKPKEFKVNRRNWIDLGFGFSI